MAKKKYDADEHRKNMATLVLPRAKMQNYLATLPDENTERSSERADIYMAAMARRIKRGGRAVAQSANDEPQSMLTDILVDLMHWADYMKANPTTEWQDPQEVDFSEALRIAEDHYAAERGGEE